MQDLSGRKLDKYELRDRLGRGGMAEVYRAYQPGMDRFVAVKVMLGDLSDDEGFVERFRREAQSVGRLRHPHIVQVFDFGAQDGIYYMVMEFIRGGNLKAYIIQRKMLEIPEALRIASQLADALDYAHNAGMVHRDLKPANVMFMDESRTNAVLTDFGIARIMGQTGLTATGAFVGTPAYVSPETARGEDTDARADLYCLGVILYEMITGKVPYDADTPLAVIMKHVNAPLPTRRDYGREIPESVEAIILKALVKDRNERYQTAAEMKTAIDSALNSVSETAKSVATIQAEEHATVTATATAPHVPDTTATSVAPPAAAVEKPRQSSMAGLIAGAVVLVAAALLVILLLTRGDSTPAAVVTEPTTTASEAAAQIVDLTEEATIAPTETNVPPTDTTEPTETDIPPTKTIGPTQAPTDEPAPTAASVAQAGAEQDQSGIIDRNALQGQIENLLASDDFDTALDRLNNRLGANPDDAESYAARAIVNALLNQGSLALADAERAIELQPDNPVGYLALSDAYFYDPNSNHPESLRAAEQALEIDPNNAQALWRVARGRWFTGEDWETAPELYQQAESQGVGGGFQFRAFYGVALYGLGRYEEAIDYLSPWRRNPAVIQMGAQHLLTGALIQVGRVDDAYELAQQIARLKPDDLGGFPALAYVAYRAGDYEQARAWAELGRSAEYNTDAVDYVLGLISWYGDGDLEAALGYLEPYVDRDFNDWPYFDETFGHEPRLDIARIYRDAGDLDEALNYYNMLLDDIDWWPDAYAERGEVHLLLGDDEAAGDDLRRAFDESLYAVPVDEDAVGRLRQRIVDLAWGDEAVDVSYPYIGFSLRDGDLVVPILSGITPLQDDIDRRLLNGEGEAIMADLDGALSGDPDNPDLLFARVQVRLAVSDQVDLALEDANRIVELEPGSPLGYIAQADVYLHWAMSDYESAADSAQQALEREPDYPEALWRLAEAQRGLGEAMAIDTFAHADQSGASGYRFARAAGNFWYDIGDYAQATRLLRTYVAAVPNDVYLTGNYLGALILVDHAEEALKTSEELVRFVDRDPGFYHKLAYVAYRAGDFEQARAWLQVYVAFAPDEMSQANYLLGLLSWASDGDADAALAYLDEVDRDDYWDDFLNLRYGHDIDLDRGRILAASGQFDDAIDAIEAAIEENGEYPFLVEELANVQIAQGETEAAIETLEHAITLTDNPDERNHLRERINELMD